MNAAEPSAWDQFRDGILRLVDSFNRFVNENGPQIEQAALSYMGADRLIKSGWLPHPSVCLVSFGKFEEADVPSVASQYYGQLSPMIENGLLASLEGTQLSDASRSSLEESVALHRAGYYRAVTRIIFPATEGIVRRDILGRRWGVDTRLQQLISRLDVIPLYDHVPTNRIYGWTLFSHLVEHCFEDVRSADQVAKFASNGIPNRHACVHGLVDYNTFQHSLNCLIFADYVVRMVARLKRPD